MRTPSDSDALSSPSDEQQTALELRRMALVAAVVCVCGVVATIAPALSPAADRVAPWIAGEGVPIARLVLEWRQLTKLKSTYTDALQEQVNKTTGRVHTSYSLSGAQTGRLASTDPNLMNIPIRTEIGRRIRDAFIADPGFVMMAADYSQIELRLAAHMCDVPELKAAFAAGEDIHNRTAQELFGAVDRDTRARAKTINFAILYGISRWGLAARLEIEPDEAQAMIARYFERFPGIPAYINETLDDLATDPETGCRFAAGLDRSGVAQLPRGGRGLDLDHLDRAEARLFNDLGPSLRAGCKPECCEER